MSTAAIHTMKVRAVPGKLFPDPTTNTRGNRKFVGWRNCNLGADGKPCEEAQHVIPGAPGVRTNGKGEWASQTSDLFLAAEDIHLTNLDENGKRIIEEVPAVTYFRVGVRDGDIELAPEIEEEPPSEPEPQPAAPATNEETAPAAVDPPTEPATPESPSVDSDENK